MIFVKFQDQFPVVAWQWKRAAGRMAAWPNSPASKLSSDVNNWVVYFPQSQKPPHRHTAEDIWPEKLASKITITVHFFQRLCGFSAAEALAPRDELYKRCGFVAWLPMYFHLGISEPDHYSLGLVRWENFMKWSFWQVLQGRLMMTWDLAYSISTWTSVLMRRHHKTSLAFQAALAVQRVVAQSA